MLFDNLEGQDGVGSVRKVQEGGAYVYLWLIYEDTCQKPTQYCKEIIPQLKINNFLKKKIGHLLIVMAYCQFFQVICFYR